GDVTTRSVPSGTSSGASAPRRTRAPQDSTSDAPDRTASASEASTTVTPAPRSSSTRAAASPETAAPATTTSTPSQGVSRPSRLIGVLVMPPSPARSCPGDPLGVEDAEPGRDAQAGDDPEPDRDRDLGPALQLEMMLQGRH